ncbi:hypothetical protein PFISCL1PPCAC_5467 [Pristionchus fissidentatus]|uniref:LisH domain-containing protein n=1 Tax=Pristionchus fissidentatus TaxID=1538716 RepID=A0AAV5V6L0_9BILA|nr:hypothetical protein PFISCL1PPCAC_5467 [Pristionchus fissidentatus]
MSAAPAMQQPGSHPGSVGTPGAAGTPQPMQQPMSNPSMLQQQQQQQMMMNQQQQQPRGAQEMSRERLMTSVHEYLLLHGAPKTAETLKIEMGPTFPNAKWATPNDANPPGFLSTWWSLFYDLYCAAPERRNEPEMASTQEAKLFHDYGFVQGNFSPMMNGMHPPFGAPGGMMGPGPDGMMQGFGARFAGRGGPLPGHPMGPGGFMFNPMGQRPPMGAMPPQQRQQGTPGSFPGMRPPATHPGQQMPPQAMYRPPFMEGAGPPGSFPAPHAMGMNGVMGMTSPGMQPMQQMQQMQHHPGAPPGYMMMPTSSAPMPPFGGMAPGVSSDGMNGPPSHPSQSAHTPLGGATNGPASAGMPGTSGAPLSAGNAGMGGMMNGAELKNSPHTPRGNGGTPGAHGGPGSGAPGSAHSGGGGSVPPPGDGITPKQEPMDTSHLEDEDSTKGVEKIKASLFSDFSAPTKDEMAVDSYGGGY